jgi:hypothetical protein
VEVFEKMLIFRMVADKPLSMLTRTPGGNTVVVQRDSKTTPGICLAFRSFETARRLGG